MGDYFKNLAYRITTELELEARERIRQATVSEEFEKLLLETVIQHKCLYVNEDPDYGNPQKTNNAWFEIAQSLKTPVPDCMNKWHNLVHIYLYKLDNDKWPHYKIFLMMEPFISRKYFQVPTPMQKDVFLSELLANSYQLLHPEANPNGRQRIWTNIVNKVNGVRPGTVMPLIKWQKYWYDLKLDLVTRWLKIRNQLEMTGITPRQDTCAAADDEVKIVLQICGATPWGSMESISTALSSNIELGHDKEIIIRQCKKCLLQANEFMIDNLCSSCRNKPPNECDLCSNDGNIFYDTTKWSKHGKNLLPRNLQSKQRIQLCETCSISINRQATSIWKECRICADSDQKLENLYLPKYLNMRKIFKNTTNMSFNEDEGLPGYICKNCKVDLEQFNAFFMKFWMAQCRLRQIHGAKFIGMKKKTNALVNHTSIPSSDGNNLQNSASNSLIDLTTPQIENGLVTAKKVHNNKQNVTNSNLECITNLEPTSTASSNGTENITETSSPYGTNQSSFVSEMFSNGEVTITRRSCNINSTSDLETPQNNSVSTTIEPRLQTIIHAIPPGQEPAPINSNLTTIKRLLNSDPTNVRSSEIRPVPSLLENLLKSSQSATSLPLTNQLPTESAPLQSENVPTPILPIKLPLKNPLPLNPSSAIATQPTKPKPVVTNRKTKAKAKSQIEKPNVFTISDSDSQENAPKMFCITKNPIESIAINSSVSSVQEKIPVISKVAGNQSMHFETMPPDIPDVSLEIKTEKIDNAYQDKTLSTIKPTIPNESTEVPRKTTPCMKLVRLNGSMVVVKPRPFINGGYMPIPAEDEKIEPPNLAEVYSTSNLHETDPVQNLQNTVEITEQQPTKAPETSKSTQNNWGSIDEFQLPTQTEPSFIIQAVPAEQTTTHTLPSLAPTVPIIKSVTSIADQFLPLEPPITIKEDPENDDVEVIDDVVMTESNIDPNPVFYPDSFDLGNVTLDADISTMIKKFIMTNQRKQPLVTVKKEKETFVPNTINNHQESEDVKPIIRVPMKNVRIRIKRLRFYEPRMTRSKTQSMRPKSKILPDLSDQQTHSIRKSLRHSNQNRR